MKSQMSSFDIAAITRELQSLVGLRVEKVFFPIHTELFFRLSGQAKKTVVIRLGQALWAEDEFRQGESEPPLFAKVLRKHISGLNLKAVSQHGFDRVVVFEFDSEPAYKLVAEMFGSGNIILVKGSTIVQPLTSKSWKARDVKAGKEYLFPPESANPLAMDKSRLAEVMGKSKKDFVRCLATEVNLGGAYAEDICARLGRAKDLDANRLTDEDISNIYKIVEEYRSQLEGKKAVILLEDGRPTDLLPFPLSIYSGGEKKEFASFNDAAREYFLNLPSLVKQEKTPGQNRRAQLERKLASQIKAIAHLESEVIAHREAGDLTYQNYNPVSTILERVGAELAEGNWQAARKTILLIEGVKDFNPKTGEFIIIIQNRQIKMSPGLSVNENAAALYEKSKKAKAKLDGAKAAALDTEKELSVASDEQDTSKPTTKKKETKRFWFERFRWFVSSEGNLVIGGRDARTNDVLVKKHLEQKDLYAHADVHGAPSVVIKNASQAGENTLTEACTYSLCFSKAWKAKVGSGSAYWVKPDQVSKTPEPGEFLARGAFVIRGKRNYSKKLAMELAVGEVSIEGERKIMCAPQPALSSQTSRYFLFVPGDEKRSGFAKVLSDHFNVPIEEIDRILPAGDVRVVKKPENI
jgi:predicted ribosome quality control (RQC) complex YloA/Tae2 family protein